MKLGPQAIWKVFIFFKILFIALFIFIFSGCSLSGSIKSVGSQKDEAPASPITSPVTGSDELRLTEPTDYIKPSNQSAYPITGSCKTTGTLTIEVNNTVVKTGVSCTSETFATTLDLTTLTSGDVNIKVYSDLDTEVVSTVTVVKDTVAPSLIGSITDGTYFNSTSTTPTLIWTAAADAHSGVEEYEIAIGTTAGGTDILNWTSTDSTSATHAQSGLTLIEGTQYFASIRAVDNAGNTSTTIQSDGWTVDATAPTLATSFTDGEINFSSTSSKVLNWVASTDAASGLSGYEVALGTTAGATDVMNWTSVGNVITDTIDSLTLFGNRRYYASLRSVDVAGNRTASVMSDGWWNLRQTKKAVDVTNPQARWFIQFFGESVAISDDGNTMAIGSSSDNSDSNGENPLTFAGSVFIYIKSGGNWILQQKISSSTRVANEFFGYDVSISGETIAVGANESVYILTRSAGVWSHQQKLLPTGGSSPGGQFGLALDLDGDTVVVGSGTHSFDENEANSITGAGAAYVFVRSAGVWTQQQKLVASGVNSRLDSDFFGSDSVAIDGETIVVGAIGQDYDASGGASIPDAGAVYVFLRSAGVWSQQQKIVPTGTNSRITSDEFGFSVSISGESIVVGAPQQDFDASGNTSVTNTGAAFVFTRSGGVWSQQQKLVATGTNSRTASIRTGNAVHIDTDTIILGSFQNYFDANGNNSLSSAGAAFIFSRTGSVWSQDQKIVATGTNARLSGDNFGYAVAMSGSDIVVSAKRHDYDSTGANLFTDAGAVFTFTKPVATWVQQQKIVNETNGANRSDLASSGYGSSVAISEDGNTLVVGASGDDTDNNGANYVSNAGAVYVYVKNSGAWVFQQKLIAIGTNARVASDSFGKSVAISEETIVVAADGQDYDANGANLISGAGALYVFTRSAGVWTQQQKLVASGTNSRLAGDGLGWFVDIDQDTIVAGSIYQDYDASGANFLNSSGAAYVFVRSTGVWSQQQKLVATGVNARAAVDFFGWSVSISGETIVVGAVDHGYDSAGANLVSYAGAVYLYLRNTGTWTQQQKIVATGANARASGDNFGASVSIDGETLVIGSPGHSFDEMGNIPSPFIIYGGAAFIYVRSAGVWSLQQKIIASGSNARMSNDYFGKSVSIDDDSIVIGVAEQDYDASGANSFSDAGAAYIFKRSGTTWTQELRLIPTGTNSRLASKAFGTSVTISENESADGYTIGIGAPGDVNDSNGGGNSATGAGSIYIFD